MARVVVTAPVEKDSPGGSTLVSPVPGTPGSGLRNAALYVLVGIVGLWFVFEPTLGSRLRLMQSDPGDPVFIGYVFEHIRSCLLRPGYAGTLWSPPFFFPARDALAYSENLLGAFPIYLLLRLGLDPLTATQVFAMAAFVLCYASFLWLLRASAVRPGLSALGAFVFAFGSFRAFHVGHLHLLVQFYSPPALVALALFLRRPTRVALGCFLCATYLQLLASIHAGWFLVFSTTVFGALYLVLDQEARRRVGAFVRQRPGFLAGAGLAWGLASALSLWPYLRVSRLLDGRSWEIVELFLPRVRSWLSAPPGTLHAGWLPAYEASFPVSWEHHLFPGVIPIVFALFALRRSAGPAPGRGSGVLLGKAAVLTALVLAGLSTVVFLDRWWIGGPFGQSIGASPWRLIYELVPGANGIRAVSRIWLATHMFLLWGGAIGAQRALAGLAPHIQRTAIGAFLLLGIVEQRVPRLPSFEKAPLQRDVEAVSRRMASGCRVAYLAVRPDRPFFVSHLVAMWAGLEANVPVVNGYSGAFPPGYPNPTILAPPEEIRRWLKGQPQEGLCYLTWPAGEAP